MTFNPDPAAHIIAGAALKDASAEEMELRPKGGDAHQKALARLAFAAERYFNPVDEYLDIGGNS